MKKILLGLITVLGLCTACSDVDLEPANYSEAVSNLEAIVTPGTRQLTLKWVNPKLSDQIGVQIIKDNQDII